MSTAPYLIVATPCYGGLVTAAYTSSMLQLQDECRRRGVRFAYTLQGGDALVTRARANLMTQFLESDGTHLLFIDADIGFTPAQALRLLDFDGDFVAASYPLKSIDWEKVGREMAAGAKPGEAAGLNYVGVLEDAEKLERRGGFARAKYVGNGFLMVKRDALLRLCAAHPELRYKNLHVRDGGAVESPFRVALFETMIDPETKAYLPEDYAFCWRFRRIGGEIWLDMQSALTHFGTVAFHGDMTLKGRKGAVV